MKQTLLLLWLAMASLTWAAPDKTKTVEVDNLFQIDIPEFMSNASGLNEGVRCMYQHALLDIAVQVLDENKEGLKAVPLPDGSTKDYNSLQAFTDLMTSYYVKLFNQIVNLEIRDVTVNSRPAKRIVINGSMNGVELCYAATFVEGKEHFYQIITMSKMEDEEKYDPMMMGIVESFKEL